MSDEETQKLIPEAFEHSPGFLLGTASRLLSRRIEEKLRPAGITIQQYGLMRIISVEGPVTQNTFAERWRVDRTTVTELVDGLEERGFVTRQKSKTDRRCNQLYLTPAGTRFLTRAKKMVEKTNKDFLAPLGEPEWQKVRESLMKLIINAGAEEH